MARRRSPARKDALLRRFAANLGRDDLLAALEASDDQRALALFAMMCDPAYSKYTLAKLCEKVGLRYGDLFDVFRRAKLQQGLLAMTGHLPTVMEELALDAMSKMRTCDECLGTGRIGDQSCLECGGDGRIRIPGDMDACRLLFEALGLIGRGVRRGG